MADNGDLDAVGRRRAAVWVGPYEAEVVTEAVLAGGGTLSAMECANVVVWCSKSHDLSSALSVLHDGVEWVQIDVAGIEHWFDACLVDDRRLWSCAKGQYGVAVAEHVVMLVLAALRRLKELVGTCTWMPVTGELLAGKTVGLLGAGGIGRELIARLAPFGVRVLALTEPGGPVDGAEQSFGPDDLPALLGQSDVVVVAAPLTRKTKGIIGRRELELIGPNGYLVNVSRGSLVQTEELVLALREGRLKGACLDVTDPEPLPPGHELWDTPNVIITPHTANVVEMEGAGDCRMATYASLVRDNVRRFVEGRPLLGVIDPKLGY